MLVEFSVSNYLSFRDKATLSLVASVDKSHPGNLFAAESAGNLSLLKSVAVYGANASGKSNLIKALTFMRVFVLTSAGSKQPGEVIPVVPFKLDPARQNQPSEFEVVFIHDRERYVYGFSLDSGRIHEEWLTVARKKSRLLFHRANGEIKFGPSWVGDRHKLKSLTRPDALFLSVAVQFDNPTAKPVIDWFAKKLRVISDQPEIASEKQYTMQLLEGNEEFASSLTQFMRNADLGLSGFRLEDGLPVTEATLVLSDGSHRTINVSPSETTKAKRVLALHKTSDGKEIAFDLEAEESAGTHRLFALTGPWIHVFFEGCTLLVDELDSKLHPLITRFLLQLVHGSDKHPQLVFTTHDCGLLDADLFRRDQIWFTEKDVEGATHLYSLWDYRIHKVRNDESFRQGYLRGRYGAIPFIGDLSFGE